MRLSPGGSLPPSAHYDFRTTEYASYPTARPDSPAHALRLWPAPIHSGTTR
jgi:hypothetical protein